jgi:hypothetical protein
MFDKEIKDMTTEELRQHLNEIRMQRKTGYEKKPKKIRSRTSSILKGIDDELASIILEKLQKEGSLQ